MNRRDASAQPPRRGRLQRPGLRLLVVWLLETAGLLLAAAILPGVEVTGAAGALAAVAVIGILNAVLYPLLASALLSISVVLFAVLALLLNAAVIVLADDLVPGFEIGGAGSALVLVLWLTLVNGLATGMLAIDDEGSYHRAVVRRHARRAARRAGRAESLTPGVLFLEIDGLSEPVLQLALERGLMPNLASWIERGSHVVTPWECDLSSQTSASQAGLLHGSNADIPAFRWYDRAEGRTIVSAQPQDAELIERRVSSGNGLLVADGASRGNMLTGDAPHVAITISGLRSARAQKAERAEAWRSFLTNPYNLPRTLLLFAGDVITEKRAARRQRRADVQPRIERGGRYPLIRAATTSFLVDATVNMLIGDIFASVPSAYATFVAYDEVAHHSGITAPDALAVLTRLDRQFARIESATRLASRPYEIVVLSDHGQSEGATFLQRHGQTLEQLVHDLAHARVAGTAGSAEEAVNQLGLAFGEAAQEGGRSAAWAARHAQAAIEPAEEATRTAPEAAGAEILVFGSGNLGLIYFTGATERLTLDVIEERHPRLVEGLAAHSGVGFVAGTTAAGTGVVIGPDGHRDLASGKVTGVDPLAPFGPHAAEHVARELGFANAPDLLVNGAYDPARGDVGAFEELVGSHGGMGGPQSHPFVLHPVTLRVTRDELVGAEEVHRMFKAWLAELAREDPVTIGATSG